MPALTLKSLLGRRAPAYAVVQALLESTGSDVHVTDPSGLVLLGIAREDVESRIRIVHEDATAGYVAGLAVHAVPIAALVQHLLSKEIESRSLGSEVLHLYREVHLIEQLSEQLAQVLDLPAVASCALDQAQRLIKATFGVIYLHNSNGALEPIATFGNHACANPLPLVASVLAKGSAEIVNDCGSDLRIIDPGHTCSAVLCAPLRSGENIRGAIVLGSESPGACYSSPDLKLLNTIALQTAAAVDNALLVAEMVEAARHRAAYAAELQAASTVQQLLLQGASRSIPGFQVEPVYVPASEVGGDFYLVYPTPDGSLIAIVGDVSGKGLTAAMRVALILGALRRETSAEPADILGALNNALVAQGQLGFTTALCVRIEPNGEFSLANAGHIPPYIDGQEFETAPALPLGLVADQNYETKLARLDPGEQMVLMSDGVPEARSATGELYGFARLPELAREPAAQIAEIARRYGQEDDITVLTIRLDEVAEPVQTADDQCETTA
ncbi:GAF domain-containing SpoIIE family protein phosphatase [Occallatibacter riparius]|uniref:SpoIIE family protein phosphatase n=1 Tax=Occallatibacter riparius TaxID=1002689 RepID=A0A9J7BPS9_9BACT|nr:GAF domain-containing SpoIIE family protein phosphatase [Occallatibacter riparius]UWZ84537.1 SpoIIE family protein phosphatase [Occallatibacter riparius]